MPIKLNWILKNQFDSVDICKEFKENYLPKGTYHNKNIVNWEKDLFSFENLLKTQKRIRKI